MSLLCFCWKHLPIGYINEWACLLSIYKWFHFRWTFQTFRRNNFREAVIVGWRPIKHPSLMNLLQWNVRGLNRASMHPEIRDRISQLHLSFVGLVETWVQEKKKNIPLVRNSFLPRYWKDFNNIQHCNLVRIWVCWSPCLTVKFLHSMAQLVHCEAIYQGKIFLVTVCYGWSRRHKGLILTFRFQNFYENAPK